MKRLSLQWRITLMSVLLIGITCVAMNLLLCSSGVYYMDTIADSLQGGGTVILNDGGAASFDPQLIAPNEELTIVVDGVQGRFRTTNWYITAAVTLLSGILAYFVSGRALKPLRSFASQVEQVQLNNLADMRIDEDAISEFRQLSRSFNQMLERLNNAFAAQRQFTGNAAHELRTPMAVIMAQCEDALSGEKTGADYREALSVIHRQGRRMNRMISGMLELVRMERKTDRYAREPFNLSALTESVCEDMALICEKNIALTTDVEPDISITGDQTLITRLLGNLIGNAYRYGRENGHIIVTLHRAGSAIELTVSDDGIGIAPDQQKKIFRRLYQGASERSGDGAGLGLAMARQIARLHGGELTVVSEEGKGSAFTARFPMQ